MVRPIGLECRLKKNVFAMHATMPFHVVAQQPAMIRSDTPTITPSAALGLGPSEGILDKIGKSTNL